MARKNSCWLLQEALADLEISNNRWLHCRWVDGDLTCRPTTHQFDVDAMAHSLTIFLFPFLFFFNQLLDESRYKFKYLSHIASWTLPSYNKLQTTLPLIAYAFPHQVPTDDWILAWSKLQSRAKLFFTGYWLIEFYTLSTPFTANRWFVLLAAIVWVIWHIALACI